MSRFDIADTPLGGLKVVQRRILTDERGSLCRLFCAEELEAAGFDAPIAQINHSCTTRRGTVRGLHFQYPPHAEIKMISCLRGEVFDVAVDLRHGSPTFLRWYGKVLTAENRASLVIPRGFAHGFQTLAEDCELLYLHTRAYSSDAEGAVNAQDPSVAIAWPLAIAALSERDRSHPFLDDQFSGVRL
jgi:dTDP-4-dehydrorhamnose 3,5-epimerase